MANGDKTSDDFVDAYREFLDHVLDLIQRDPSNSEFKSLVADVRGLIENTSGSVGSAVERLLKEGFDDEDDWKTRKQIVDAMREEMVYLKVKCESVGKDTDDNGEINADSKRDVAEGARTITNSLESLLGRWLAPWAKKVLGIFKELLSLSVLFVP